MSSYFTEKKAKFLIGKKFHANFMIQLNLDMSTSLYQIAKTINNY